MNKILAILFLSFLWCETSNAGLNEPGKKNNLVCTIAGLEAFHDGLDYLKRKPKNNFVVYLACDPPNYSWNWKKGKNLEKLHKKSFKECTKHSKKAGNGECYLFSVNEKILWELSEEKMASLLKISSKKLKTRDNILVKPIFSSDGMKDFEKNIIKKKDPSTFLNLKFIERKNIAMEETDPDNFETYKNVYIFKALFKNNHEVIIRVHPNFNMKRAEKIAYELSYGIGQLPFFLTKSYKRANVFKSKLYNKETKKYQVQWLHLEVH